MAKPLKTLSTAPPVVLGYARVSTASQADGLDAQLRELEAMAGRLGLAMGEIVVEGEDDANPHCSGDSAARVKLDRTLGQVMKGGVGSTLLVREMSRLGRDATDMVENVRMLLDANVRIVCTLEGYDTETPSGKHTVEQMLILRAWMAEEEKKSIVARLTGGRKAAKARGEVYASEPSYGYRVEASKVVEDPSEQTTLARIRALRAEGLGPRKIAATLDREGVKPRRAAKWPLGTITALLYGRPKAKTRTSRQARNEARAAVCKAAAE